MILKHQKEALEIIEQIRKLVNKDTGDARSYQSKGIAQADDDERQSTATTL